MRITTNNGTTISGSLSEVLATLSHLGVKAEDTNPVTTVNVSGTTVTKADDVDKIAQSIFAELHAGETVTPAPETTPVPVPKPARDSVIKMAIADVKDLLNENYNADEVETFIGESLWFASKGTFTVTDEVLFTVNANKRTVTAVIRHISGGHKVLSKGRAKCAPGDVFNEHIGKAVALRRALGLEVPVEYYEVEARDSDDLAVGDVVKGIKYGHQYELIAERDNPAPWQHAGAAFNTNTHEWLASSQVTLINDSARHTAPDLEVSRIIRH